MANDDHIAQLMKGVDAWNAWRQENYDISPDLSEANLSEARVYEPPIRPPSEAQLRAFKHRVSEIAKENPEISIVAEWGENMPKLRYGQPNLGNADRPKLRYGPNLGNADLSRARLNGSRLINANLYGASLYGADLSGADLSGASLYGADLSGADLSGAGLREADLTFATLRHANLSGADLSKATPTGAHLDNANLTGANLDAANLEEADLRKANLSKANLSKANLRWADLGDADLSGANLEGANLQTSTLVGTDFTDADLTGSRIHGVSAWDLKLERAKQQNLVITPDDEPAITVDNIEVAQFIYLILHNEKVRDVIDTITSKAVLILGRFTDERKAVLDALRDELRKHDYLPILFC